MRTGTRWMDLSGAGDLATAFAAFSSAASASSSPATLRRKDLPAGDPRERRCIAAAAAADFYFLLVGMRDGSVEGYFRGFGRGRAGFNRMERACVYSHYDTRGGGGFYCAWKMPAWAACVARQEDWCWRTYVCQL